MINNRALSIIVLIPHSLADYLHIEGVDDTLPHNNQLLKQEHYFYKLHVTRTAFFHLIKLINNVIVVIIELILLILMQISIMKRKHRQ